MQALFQRYLNGNLVMQIVVGIIAGIILGTQWPQAASSAGALGDFFISALKAVAPILVFILVTHAIAQHQPGQPTNIRAIIVLYIMGTFLAALTAVIFSLIWPVTLGLDIRAATTTSAPPTDLLSVLKTLVFNMVDNPVHAILNANYIGILVWAALIGISLRHTQGATRALLNDAAEVISQIVSWVIRLAPFGIFGLISFTIADKGIAVLQSYAQLLAILLGAMLFVALVMNPLIVWWKIRENPYPLVITCLLESGITAFFMRSSAANIPVNLSLSRKLGLKEETYSISIPLGATINMAGAAITITVMTLAAANTLHYDISFFTALPLCFLATLGACGASGVPGGSLLLIPMACSLFNIDSDIALKVVGVGFIIGVIQDSAETGLNSSTDVLFTAAADIAAAKREARHAIASI